MTPNTTLSIPNALKGERPEDYYKNTVTIEWPTGAYGQPLAIVTVVSRAAVFKDGGHVATAKEFVRFLVGEGWLAHWLDFAGDRFLPPMPELLEQPFWLDPSDPHRMAAAMQFLTQPRDLRLRGGLRRLAAQPVIGETRLGEADPPRRGRRHHPRAGGRRGDRAHQADPGGVR